jgi:hypothetical protein
MGMIAIAGGIMTIPTFVATPADLKQLKEELTTEFKKSMELDRNIVRLNQINDSLIRARIQQRQYPKDKDIAEDVESLKADKAEIQKQIDDRNKQK